MDINANGNFDDDTKIINLSMNGNVVYIQDVTGLFSLTEFNSSVLANADKVIVEQVATHDTSQEKNKQDTKNVEKSDESCWDGLEVGITANIQKLAFSEQYSFSNLELKADVNDTCISVDNLSANCAGAPFEGKAKITFSPKTDLPYNMDGDFSIKSFDIGRLYDAVNESKEIISGHISSNCSIFSSGASLSDTLENCQLKIQIDGDNGKIMALKSVNNTTKSAMIIANVAASIFSKKDQQRTNVINSIMEALNCIVYDTLSCEINRGTSKDIELKFLCIKGPDVIISSSGQILFSSTKPVIDQRLILNTKLYAAGKMAVMLNDLGLLYENDTRENYYAGPTFTIRGTLRDPNLAELKNILKAAGAHVLQNTFF